MQDYPTKTDGVSTEPAAEYNNLAAELKTNITSWGNSLNAGLTNQLAEIITIGGQTATIYSDGGAADSYVLTAIPATRIEPTAYFNGQTLKFLPDNTNTGASTVNVSGLGAIAIKQKDGTTDVTAGQIVAAEYATMTYDGTVFRLQSLVSDVLPGANVQVVNIQTGAFIETTVTIPFDDTIPQNTEGTEVMTLAVTPTDASNLLRIDTFVFADTDNANGAQISALFQDSTADALASGYSSGDVGTTVSDSVCIVFTHMMTAGTTSSTTFKMRTGNSAGNSTFNGKGAARTLGGSMASSMIITEIQV